MSRTVTVATVVVFGEPAVGKSLLLANLAALNKLDLSDEPFYACIGEPTSEPEISAAIKRVYEESGDAIESGRSEAIDVQALILKRRIEQFHEFFELGLARALKAARAAGRRTLVVVCDGHTLTDSYLYVRSRIASGQIRADEFAAHEVRQRTLLGGVQPALVVPDAFVQLAIGDRSGETHRHRIVEYRRTATECNVAPHTFAELARHADMARVELERRFAGAAFARLTTDDKTPRQVCNAFRLVVRRCALDGATRTVPVLGRALDGALSPRATGVSMQ